MSAEGDKVLNVLAMHPSTANFISTKMIRWLLRYDAPPALVSQVAATYLSSGGNIPAMIRVIMTPANLAAAPAKHKRPFHYVASALRALNPTVKGVAGIAGTRLAQLGQQSFLWATPDGYPDKIQFWSGLVLQRWNFGDYIANLTTGEVVVDTAQFTTVNTPDGITSSINALMFGGEMPARTRDAVLAFLTSGSLTSARVRETLGLAIDSSTFQWY